MNSTLALVDMTNTSEVIHAIFEKDKVEIAYLLSWMIRYMYYSVVFITVLIFSAINISVMRALVCGRRVVHRSFNHCTKDDSYHAPDCIHVRDQNTCSSECQHTHDSSSESEDSDESSESSDQEEH
jgi:hypothetical protein